MNADLFLIFNGLNKPNKLDELNKLIPKGRGTIHKSGFDSKFFSCHTKRMESNTHAKDDEIVKMRREAKGEG